VQGVEARLAFDLRATWQARMLVAAQEKREGVIGAVTLSVLAHSYGDTITDILLPFLFPGFSGLRSGLCSAAKVDKSGAIVADHVEINGSITRNHFLYRDEIALRDDFRRLADQLKLPDADRVEMFAAVKRWVVADRRLDPNMDPQDPDAKRLVH
jgi:hypothetical protein